MTKKISLPLLYQQGSQQLKEMHLIVALNWKKDEIQEDSSIAKIMDGTFSNCTSLTAFVIPKNVDYFGKETLLPKLY